MKRKFIISAAAMFMLMTAFFTLSAAAAEPMKGVWVSSVYGIDYPKTPSREPSVLKVQADEILDKCVDLGFNAVFLQVRPTGDALYNSAVFPCSEWLTGKQGDAPYDGFDVLEYWVWAAHERGLELHAWINPYRVTIGKRPLSDLAENNPAVLHPEYLLESSGNYYYNPALPEVRRLITDGINEIADNYEVDGIHLDDYFYPSAEVDDLQYYEYFNTDGLSIEDWRRSNCDALIKGISDELGSRGVTFGVSPSGIWANKRSNPLGSDTAGKQSYYEVYADTRKWAIEGWIDYIAPQIYWEIGNSAADYETLLNWWSDTLSDSETLLYIGIPDYKCEDAEEDSVWHDGFAVREQLALNSLSNRVNGEIHFSYSSVANNYALDSIVSEYNWTGFISRDNVSVYLDGRQLEFDVKPVILNSRTLVPMRVIFEALGMEVVWDGDSRKITASGGGNVIEMTIDENIMYVNGEAVTLDIAPRIARSRTLVPIRAITESLGATVDWEGQTQTVNIWS